MNGSQKLLAVGTLLLAAACSDGATTPSHDDIEGARSATKSATSIRMRTENVGADGSVTYSVRVRSNVTTLSSVQGAITFAPGLFDLVSQASTPVTGGMVMVNTTEMTSGRIRFAAFSQTRINGAGEGTELFRVTLRQVRSGDPSLTSVLDVIGSAASLVAAGPGTIASQGCAGTTLWGDGNADGNVNVTDAQQLARYSAGLAVGNLTAVTGRGDVTADGSVNIVDAQQIARYSVGLSSAPRTSTWIC